MKNKYKEIKQMREKIQAVQGNIQSKIDSAFEYLVDPKMLNDMLNETYIDSNMTNEQKIIRFLIEEIQSIGKDMDEVQSEFWSNNEKTNWDKVNKIK